MSRTDRRQVRTTVSLGDSMLTLGSGGAMSSGCVVSALQSSVDGYRPDWVRGSQRRHVCQTPFGSIVATNVNRPLANCGFESFLSTWMSRLRRKLLLVYVVRSERRAPDHRVVISPRRTRRRWRTSNTSAKSDVIAISSVIRIGRRE